MEDLVKDIKFLMASFTADAEKRLAGNKAAGTRARKSSLSLEKLLKEYRKVSVLDNPDSENKD